MIDFDCPKCGEGMSVPDCLAGRSETCPACGNVDVVPWPSVQAQAMSVAGSQAPPAWAQPASPSPRRSPSRQPGRREIVCPNPHCGYVGKPIRRARGSLALGCLLTILVFPIGLIYLLFTGGYRYYCPVCKMQIART